MNIDHWIKELDAEQEAHKDYRRGASRVIEILQDEKKRNKSKFNILWANVQVLKGAVYSSTPSPDVRRRYLDKDPLGKAVSEVIERSLSFCIDNYDFDGEAERAVENLLAAGLGQCRVRYQPYFVEGEPERIDLEPEIEMLEAEDEFTEPEVVERYRYEGEEVTPLIDEIGAYIEGDPVEEIAYEEVPIEYVPYDRFRWQPATSWSKVMWAAIDHFLSKEELEEQFPDKADQVPLGYTTTGEKVEEGKEGSHAMVHEIFCKKTRKVYMVVKGMQEFLDTVDDPLELENFYPFPKPLTCNLKSGKFEPIPDYVFYKDQVDELDNLTGRIDKIVDQIRVRGVYDSAFKRLEEVMNADDGQLIPVEDFARLGDGKSFESVIKMMDIEMLVKVLASLYQAREDVKQVIYEITGIADIVRGSTKASETLGAQQLKGQYANMRLENRRREVSRFFRDLLRIKAEVISEHFSVETLQIMTGQEITPEMEEILRSDALRAYKVDIETDSTVAADASEEQKNRSELLTAITGFMQQVAPAVQMGYMPVDVAKEMILWGVRSFKGGRQLEDALEQLGGDNTGAIPGAEGMGGEATGYPPLRAIDNAGYQGQ